MHGKCRASSHDLTTTTRRGVRSDEHCDHLIQLAESRGKWFDGRPYGAPEYCAQFLLPLDRCVACCLPIKRERRGSGHREAQS